MKHYQKTICPLDCPDTCGLVATLESGKITTIQGDPDHPVTRGFICRKMRHYAKRLYSKNRLLYPQIRVGKKGEGKFKRISWVEAFKILVKEITRVKREYGGEAILPYSYAGNMGAINRWACYPLFHKLGASRLIHTVCSTAAAAGWEAQCGSLPGTPPEKASESDIIVLWGINVKTTNIHFWPQVQQSRRKGGKLIVIDPYLNKTAKAADFYFQVKPGGDSALALAIIKLMIEKNTINKTYIQDFTTNFQPFKTYLETVRWPELEQQSGITRQKINLLYQLLIQHPKTFFRIGMGLTRNSTGAMAIRTITALATALGLFANNYGQGVLLTTGSFSGGKKKLTYPELLTSPTRKINMVQLGDALVMDDKPIKLLFVYNSNPLSIAPDSSKVRDGLKRADLFTIVHEQVLTPTTMYADLLLPATTFLENSDIFTAYGHCYLGRTEPVIKPMGESLSNFELFQTLASKLKLTDTAFKQNLEDRLTDYLSTLDGLPDDFIKADFKPGTYIASKYQDIKHYIISNDWKYHFKSKLIFPEFPELLINQEFDNPKITLEFPLKLITPPCNQLLNSTFGDQYQDEIGFVLIHPQDAEKYHISPDFLIRIENQRGFTIRKVKITTDTQAGLLVAEGIFWENSTTGFKGINDLTSQKTTDLGAGGTFHESRVRIKNIPN
jgi:anaerobic selenocysteine-containing dehydrogenase